MKMNCSPMAVKGKHQKVSRYSQTIFCIISNDLTEEPNPKWSQTRMNPPSNVMRYYRNIRNPLCLPVNGQG